jgi:ribosomal subunit interface protein
MEVKTMQITVQGKQMSVGEALRNHVSTKLEEMNSKYFNHGTDANVTFSKEGHGHGLIRAHISVRIGSNIMVLADASESDAYLSFDSAAEKAAKQLRRYKRRLRDHQDRLRRAPELEEIAARDYTISPDNDSDKTVKDESLVIAEMATNIPTLTVSEAVMRLDLAHQNAFLFRSAKHGGINMVYRRNDGNIGWVDPGDVAKVVKPVEKSGDKPAKKAVAKKAPGKKTAKKPVAKTNVKKLPVKKKAAPKKAATKKAKKRA